MTATNPYLKYSKLILDKVSFDRGLFRKEYRKALRLLSPEEGEVLKSWLRGTTNPDLT